MGKTHAGLNASLIGAHARTHTRRTDGRTLNVERNDDDTTHLFIHTDAHDDDDDDDQGDDERGEHDEDQHAKKPKPGDDRRARRR